MTREPLTRWCLGTLVIITIAVTHAGCRRRDPYADAVAEITRAEKMDLEDQIYALEDQVAQKERELEALRGRTPVRTTPPAARAPRTRAAMPPPAVMDDAELTPPSIDHGVPLEPKIELPPIDPTPVRKPDVKPPAAKPPVRPIKPAATSSEVDDLPPPNIPEPAAEALPAPPTTTPSFRKPANEPELVDPSVSNVFINPFHTAGVELDQQPGDDGLRILFEPRNAAGQFVPQTGPVTIVAIDPAVEGDKARVGKWELSKTEVSQRMLDARPERGVKVQLKWPDQRPEHSKLKLFVRYTTTDGRQVEGHSDVFVTLPGQISQRWTPRRE
jgi:hypothetical protein